MCCKCWIFKLCVKSWVLRVLNFLFWICSVLAVGYIRWTGCIVLDMLSVMGMFLNLLQVVRYFRVLLLPSNIKL